MYTAITAQSKMQDKKIKDLTNAAEMALRLLQQTYPTFNTWAEYDVLTQAIENAKTN